MNYELRIMRRGLIMLVILGLILPSFSFAQPAPISPPETLDQAKQMGGKALEVSKKELPGILEKIWKEEILPLWQKMYDWFKKTVWQPYLEPVFKKELEKRRPGLEEEFKKEKEETKTSARTDVPKALKSLWERLKELIK